MNDNTTNMSGKYSGLLAHHKNVNWYMYYIPCSTCSPNLVRVNVMESCECASNFLGFVQFLCNFYVPSAQHWWSICISPSSEGRPVTL